MMTITEVSRSLEVSARMLRYYEQQGLIVSSRRENYAYRVYDQENISRLRLILVLRRLRVPLKDIGAILSEGDAAQALTVLQGRLAEVEAEIRSLETIREVLGAFVERIGAANAAQRVALLGDEALLSAVRALGLSQNTLKERVMMNELHHAEQEQWKTLNVRYVLLPEMTVAAFHYIGPDPEDHVSELAQAFVRESGLYLRKPDARAFGFNHPNPTQEKPVYGYEIWVTIPEDMEVPPPGVKKIFPGGLYAAHTIDFPNFHEWQWLDQWVRHHEKYCYAYDSYDGEIMGGLLEEHLNWVHGCHHGWPEDGIAVRLDLLLPIRKK